MGNLCSLPGRACFVKAKKSMKRDKQAWSETTICITLNKVYPPTISARESLATHSCWLASFTQASSNRERKNPVYDFPDICPQLTKASLKDIGGDSKSSNAGQFKTQEE